MNPSYSKIVFYIIGSSECINNNKEDFGDSYVPGTGVPWQVYYSFLVVFLQVKKLVFFKVQLVLGR